MTVDPELLELEPAISEESHDLQSASRAVIELATPPSEVEVGVTHIVVNGLEIGEPQEIENGSSVREKSESSTENPPTKRKKTNRSSSTGTKDGVRQYLDEIGEIPLLKGREEEAELAQLIEKGKLAQARLNDNPEKYTAAEKRADKEATQEGEAAREDFIRANLKLVIKIAKRIKEPGNVSFLDLIQEGNIGLAHAVEKFDYRRGFKFSTYATWWIHQHISRAVDQQASTIRLSGRVAPQKRRAWVLIENGISEEEICAEMDLSPDEFRELMDLPTVSASLDRRWGESEEADFYNLVADSQSSDAFLNFEDNEAASPVIKLAQGILDTKDFDFLMLCFGLEDGQVRTNKELGATYGATSEQARSRKYRIVEKIKEAVELYGLSDPEDY